MPVVIYDGDCGFCKKWIFLFEKTTSKDIVFMPYQGCNDQFESTLTTSFSDSVHLCEGPKAVSTGAKAIYKLLHLSGKLSWLLWLYNKVGLFRTVSEWGYTLVAQNRRSASKLTNTVFGKSESSLSPLQYSLTAMLFTKGLGAIYLSAFIALLVQFHGLLGSDGILPISNAMSSVASQIKSGGFFKFPTLFWISSTDTFALGVIWAGILASLAIIAGVVPGLSLGVAWLSYLSFVKVGSYFYSFQWDILLLEVGFLAIFLTPWQWLSTPSTAKPPSRLVVFVFRVLLFRFMLTSGLVKLVSNDSLWWDLKALTVHYQTQPLPHAISWYAHNLSGAIHKLSCFIMFVIELAIPFLFLLTRRFRQFGGVATIALMAVIIATGNYGFFNVLVIVMCILLFDDSHFKWLSFSGKKSYFAITKKKSGFTQTVPILSSVAKGMNWGRTVVCVLLLVTAIELELSRFVFQKPITISETVNRVVRTNLIVNGYGLFAVMTKDRPEIIIEGSNNGVDWQAFDFKYKPGRPERRPKWVMPYHPRLDWQMWFAALGSPQSQPWIMPFMQKLLEGSQPVLNLLSKDSPFQINPPLYIRASLYDYEFTTPDQKRETGDWWSRRFIRPFTYVMMLKR